MCKKIPVYQIDTQEFFYYEIFASQANKAQNRLDFV